MSLWRMAVTHQRFRSRARPGRAIRSALAAALLLGGAGVRAEPALQVNSTWVRPGERVVARYSGYTPSSAAAWIGFYRADADADRYISYTFLNNLDDNAYDVQAPAEAGSFNFRLFADEGYRPIAVSPAVTVGDQPPPAAAATVRSSAGRSKHVHYAGQSQADGRAAELDLFFRDDQVSGRLQVKGESGANIRLPSTDISFSNLTFTGKWEVKETNAICGTWTGGDYADGRLMDGYPTQGQVVIVPTEDAGREIVFLHRTAGSMYGYVFPAQGEVWEAGPAVAGDPPDLPGGSGGGSGGGEGSGAGGTGDTPPPPPDADQILSLALTPDAFKMAPDTRRELPGVVAILKQSLNRVTLAPDQVEWALDRGGSLEGGFVVLGKAVAAGETLSLTAALKDAPAEVKAQAKITVVSEIKLGSFSVVVVIDYSPHVEGDDIPRRARSATVELRSARGTGKPVQSGVVGGDECVVFKNVEPGQYHLWITAVTLPPLPGGYVPAGPLPVQCPEWFDVPNERWTEGGTVLEYDRKIAARYVVRVPRPPAGPGAQGAVLGRVLYKGEPVPAATINVTRAPYTKLVFVSNARGEYRIDTAGMEPGEYRLTVEKYVHPGTASGQDYLDIDSAKNEKPFRFPVPLVAVGDLTHDIDTLTRAEIFGAMPEGDAPPALP